MSKHIWADAFIDGGPFVEAGTPTADDQVTALAELTNPSADTRYIFCGVNKRLGAGWPDSLNADEQAIVAAAAAPSMLPAITHTHTNTDALIEVMHRMTAIAHLTTFAERQRYDMCRDLALWAHTNIDSDAVDARYRDSEFLRTTGQLRRAWTNPSYPAALIAGLPMPVNLRTQVVFHGLLRSTTPEQVAAVLANWPTPYSQHIDLTAVTRTDPALPVTLLAGLLGQHLATMRPGRGVADAAVMWLTYKHDVDQALQGLTSVDAGDPIDRALVEFIAGAISGDDERARRGLAALPSDAPNQVAYAIDEVLAATTDTVTANAFCEALTWFSRRPGNKTPLGHTTARQQDENLDKIDSADLDVVDTLLTALAQAAGENFSYNLAELIPRASKRLGWKPVDVPLAVVHGSDWSQPSARALRATGHVGVNAIAAYLAHTAIPAFTRRQHLGFLRTALEADPDSVLQVDDQAWVGIGRLTTNLPIPALTTLATHGGPKGKRLANRALAAALA